MDTQTDRTKSHTQLTRNLQLESFQSVKKVIAARDGEQTSELPKPSVEVINNGCHGGWWAGNH